MMSRLALTIPRYILAGNLARCYARMGLRESAFLTGEGEEGMCGTGKNRVQASINFRAGGIGKKERRCGCALVDGRDVVQVLCMGLEVVVRFGGTR